jgi:hypothetical protein
LEGELLMDELIQNIQDTVPIVAHELTRAQQLAAQEFYTEACLRLGRSVEATLYGTAREAGIALTDLRIKILANLQQSIGATEINIIRQRSLEAVRTPLSNISKQLSLAIADLVENPILREGTQLSQSEPRRTQSLFGEIMQLTYDPATKRLLGKKSGVLDKIQTNRNKAAHASLEGGVREFSVEDYESLKDRVCSFIEVVVRIIVDIQAKKNNSK